MEHLFRTVSSESYHFICDEIKYISTSGKAIKEMGEPFIVERGQTWIFAYLENELVGFCAYVGEKILYFYTVPEHRGKGVFNILYNEIPDRSWEVIASNDSYPIFVKKGFKVVKNYKTCHKLKLYGNN